MAPDELAVTPASHFDAILVGAGPAGSAAASTLAELGRRVLVLEKDHFPRPKVCGEFLSSSAFESLERMRLRQRVAGIAETIRRGSVHLPGASAVDFPLPEPALGISRFCLDDLLAGRAKEMGADIRFGARVVDVETDPRSGFRVRFVSGQREEEAKARAVVGAWGRWDGLDRALDRGFLARGTRFLGWSRDYEADSRLEGQVRLYAFPGGYCGLSRVEGGRVNLAGVLSERSRRRLDGGWESVVEHARSANSDLDRDLSSLREGPIGFLGTGPVFFTAKPPVEAGILMVGDAAGVIDPFSGEGQSAALASGILVAETLERGLAGDVPLSDVPSVYAAVWRTRFRRRFGWSAAFRRLMLHPALGSLAPPAMRRRIVRFAIGRLSSRASP